MRNLIYRVGHRGTFLSFLALLDGLYGYSILSDTASLTPYHLWLKPAVWGVVWLGTGVFLATGVPMKHDRFHYSVASILFAGWTSAMVNVWITQDTPRIWVDVVLFAAFAALVVVVSSWPELRRLPEGNGDE
jgi:hypothetical protein